MNRNNKSEVAYFREQQALQEEAAQRGLSGLAAVAQHAMITARMERGADRILRLIQEGKHEEAQMLMATDAWGLEEQEEEVDERPLHITRKGRDPFPTS